MKIFVTYINTNNATYSRTHAHFISDTGDEIPLYGSVYNFQILKVGIFYSPIKLMTTR